MKKEKKNINDRINARPKQKKLNPFEVHINKKKYDVVGKKTKTEKGLPGISRSRAIKKRKATLLQEYTLKNKVNQFVDRRIGERDSAMTQDDKILARYTTERMRFHSRKSLYNLGDDEILTHRGESLADIEKFDDPKSDDEDDEERDKAGGGKLDEAFVSEAHFGGGILKRVDGENKSRKDLIDQMIADSKKRKAEKQKLREQTLDMTEKLDTAWRDILPLVASKKARVDETVTLKSDNKYATYDKLSKELMFEARGKASDKLKSESEIAQLEKSRLEELEKKRQERMFGEPSKEKKIKHRSADDLDDGFDYNDTGKPKKKKKGDDEDDDEDADESLHVLNNGEQHSSEEDEESNDLNGDKDNNDSDEEEDNDTEIKSEAEDDGEEKNEESNDIAEDDCDSEDSARTEDNLSDLQSSDSEDESPSLTEKIKSSYKKKVKQSDKLSKSLKDLSFTLKVPETYEDFEDICADQEAEYQAVVVERMIKNNHPSLPDGSRAKLVTLFGYCLQHLQDIASSKNTKHSTFKVLNRLAPWLYDLTQFATATATSMLSDVMKEKYEDFLKRPRRFPSIDTIVFFKLVGILYPTSDFRHRLVTPTLVFMEHVLSSCRVETSVDVTVGLLYVTLILEYTALSKRFTPEAINFLRNILRSAHAPDSTLPKSPFYNNSTYCLYVPKSYRHSKSDIPFLGVNELIMETDSAEFKLRATNLALQLLDGFCDNLDKSSEYLILEPFVSLVNSNNYNNALKAPVEKVKNRIIALKNKKLYKLVSEKKRPKPLKLYEPKIEDVYTFKKKRPMAKEKEEHDKLLYKYKKEVKGALREIRRDNSFIAKLKYSETKASDLERQRKVKEIFSDAAQQAGDLNKLKRK